MNALGNVMDHIKATHGVLGACLLGPQGVLASNLPTAFNADSLQKVYRAARLMRRAVESAKIKTKNLLFDSTAGKLIIFSINEDHDIFVVCTRNVHAELLAMSVHVSTPEIMDILANPLMAPNSTTAPVSVPQPQVGPPMSMSGPHPVAPTPGHGVVPTPSASAPVVALNEQSIAFLTKALSQFLGPAARVVWSKSYKKWQQSGGSTDDLINRLADEIDAPVGKRQFLQLVRQTPIS